MSAGGYQGIHCRWAKQVLQPGEVPWYCSGMEWTELGLAVLSSMLDLISKTFSSCNDPGIQWWMFESAGLSCPHGWKCITAIAPLVWWTGLLGAQIKRGVEEKRKTADECLKGSVMDLVFFKISLCQCACKAISSNALSTITILKSSFHDSLKCILPDSQELPNLWCSCK